jgi:hypothetical protein
MQTSINVPSSTGSASSMLVPSEFIYTDDLLTRINYSSPVDWYKLFVYTDGVLTSTELHKNSTILETTYVYTDGVLTGMSSTEQ